MGCLACDHLHDPTSPGTCWEAACLPQCPEHLPGSAPFTYQPSRPL